eukprot:TRINITY_DN29203_c0_g1_i1.p1 TRINITY_DN29203_c0_g1~~TRINITY_DN29203_c0_g1_i1.p1  ORF type:complete len:653 (-),score=59.19 TRINITY_DN29203_c0_g1_i1:99-2057(-)
MSHVGSDATMYLRPGRSVRVRGVATRPVLNGLEGLLVRFDTELGRWVVRVNGREHRLSAANLEVLDAPHLLAVPLQPPECLAPPESSAPPSADQFSERVICFSSGSAVLGYCEQRRSTLSVREIVAALRQISKCYDHGIRRADPRFISLLERLRELMDVRMRPSDLMEVLDVMVSMDLRSHALLEILTIRVTRQVPCFAFDMIAPVLLGFLALDHTDQTLFDTFSARLLRCNAELLARDVIGIGIAFKRAKLGHFRLLDWLISRFVAHLGRLSDDDLVEGAAVFVTSETLRTDIVEAISEEVICRVDRLGPDALTRIGTVLAAVESPETATTPLPSLPQCPLPLKQPPFGASAVLHALIQPQRNHRLRRTLAERAHRAARLVRELGATSVNTLVASAEEELADDLLSQVALILSDLEPSKIGYWGARVTLNELNVSSCDSSFLDRSRCHIRNFSSFDLELFETGDAKHRCPSAFAEYSLSAPPGYTSASTGNVVFYRNGSSFQHSRHVLGLLLCRHSISGEEPCPLLGVLSELYWRMSCLFETSPLQERMSVELLDTRGCVKVYLRKLPRPVGWFALGCFMNLFPSLAVSVAVGIEDPMTQERRRRQEGEELGKEDLADGVDVTLKYGLQEQAPVHREDYSDAMVEGFCKVD